MNIPHRKTAEGAPRWRTKTVLWITTGVLIAWLGAMLRLVAFPTGLSTPEQIQQVDAIYVLGVATTQRLAKGRELMEYTTSDHLVVTVTEGNPLSNFCAADHPYTVHCVTPQPVTTGGEAQQWQHLAQQHDWDSVALVTSRSHATRASWYFNDCHPGQTFVVDDTTHQMTATTWLGHFGYETGAMIKFIFARGC